MRHYPIYLNMDAARIVLAGGGDAALAKLRLLMKTSARLEVYASTPAPEILDWARRGLVVLYQRDLVAADLTGATLAYAADDDAKRDAATVKLARAAGVLVNAVDNLAASDFITPAIVDRAPLTVAIGTEGAAPMLARRLKATLEAELSASLGPITRAAQSFRDRAEALPHGRARRAFWSDYFDHAAPLAYAKGGDTALGPTLTELLEKHLGMAPQQGQITLTWAGSDDPELLTLKARKALDVADVVFHDAAISPALLELARREAVFIALKRPTNVPPLPRLLTRHADKGAHVLYLSARPLSPVLAQECRATGLMVQTIPGIPAETQITALKETA